MAAKKAAKKKSVPLVKVLACCFVCDRPLGSTYMTASKYVPATCLRCGGRVHGLVLAAMEPLIALLRGLEWGGGGPDGCLVCHEDPGMDATKAMHKSDCAMALAIGGRIAARDL